MLGLQSLIFRKQSGQETLGPDSSVVEHLHGKQVVVGSIPILGMLYSPTLRLDSKED